MKLMIVAEDPQILGGIPVYAVPLAKSLSAKGIQVDYLYSGGYSGDYDWSFRRRWRTRSEGDVRFHGLVNARSIGVNSGHPELDVYLGDAADIARRARSLAPDVIHIHSFLGIPVEVLGPLSEIGPVVATFHDFGLICQRRVLVKRDQTLCTSYASQTECGTCVEPVDPGRYRLRARLRNSPGEALLRGVHGFERLARRDVTVSEVESVADEDSTTARYVSRLSRSVALANRYISRALAVSGSVEEILLRAGLNSEILQVMHIASTSAGRFARLPLPSTSKTYVTFLYLGGFTANKGAHVLVDAGTRLADPPRVLLAGRGHAGYEAELAASAPETFSFLGPFTAEQLPRLLREADVLVAPTVGPDTSPQVVLEALAAGRPVIGSRIGGIPDFVEDGVNGRLFEAGDSTALAALLEELSDPVRVAELSRRSGSVKSVAEHVAELQELYAGLR